MRKISLKTKIETSFLLLLIILITISFSVSSLTRTISDDSDNIITFIRCTDGDIWEATGDNLEIAINEKNDSKEKLILPPGEFFVDQDLTFRRLSIIGSGNGGFTGDYGNTEIILESDSEITMGYGSRLKDLRVYVDSRNEWTGDTAVTILANDGWAFSWTCHENILENVHISDNNGWEWDGTGLKLEALDGAIGLCSFSHVVISGFEYSLVIHADDCGDNGYINCNSFYDFQFMKPCHLITMEGTNGGSICCNEFFGIHVQATEETVDGIHLKNTSDNYFLGVDIMDWYDAIVSPRAKQVNITTNNCRKNKIEFTLGNPDKVVDLGQFNKITFEGGYDSLAYGTGYTMMPQPNADGLHCDNYYLLNMSTNEEIYNHDAPSSIISTAEAIKDGVTIKAIDTTYEWQNWLIGTIDDFRVEGDSKHTTIFHAESDVNTAMYAMLAMANWGDDVTFKDITFDADQHRSYIIHSGNVDHKNYTFENCVFKGSNSTQYLHYLNYGSNWEFINCDFYGKEVYVANMNNVTFKDCTFYDATADAIEIKDSEQIKVINCQFENFGDDAIYLHDSEKCTITQNTFYSSSGDTAILIDSSQDNIIQSNHVSSCDDGISETGSSNYNIIALNNLREATNPISTLGADNQEIGNIS